MNVHDAQTLMAFHYYYRRLRTHRRSTCSDMMIARAGAELFGEGWTSVKQSRYGYRYAPLVSMSLGRLRRLGLVRRNSPSAGVDYHFWALADEGRVVAEALLVEHGLEAVV